MTFQGSDPAAAIPIEDPETKRPAVKLELHRRHTDTCPDRKRGRNWLKCSGKRPCPLYCDGTIDGKRVRRSLGRDLGRAEKRIAMMEDSRGVTGLGRDHSLARMVKIYLDTCRQKKLAGSTLRRYTRTLNQMMAFTGPDPSLGPTFLDTLTQFRASMDWHKANTVRGNTVCLRSFFNWALKRGWISKNWSSLLDLPENPGGQTQPFTEAEIAKLLAACDRLSHGCGRTAEEIRARARAFVMALLYTGLRISDVVRLSREQISGGKLLMSMQKTGEPIYLRLQPALLTALEALPQADDLKPGHYFWSSGSSLETQCGSWRRTLHRLEKHAGVAGVIRAHRFRDTLAKTILDNGYPLSTVQKLLGHTDIRTTERYYAHFSSEQQRIMDEAMGSLNFNSEKRPTHARTHARLNRRRNANRNIVSFPTSA
jgi:site-specific recombinase XerD